MHFAFRFIFFSVLQSVEKSDACENPAFFWLGLIVLLWTFTAGREAAQQPTVALFNGEHGNIMSVATWSDIDFGRRSAMGGGRRPARVFALEATLPVVGQEKSSKDDERVNRDLYFFPYCSVTKNSADKEDSNAPCSLSHFEGYILLRFRGGWEENFAVSLWQDSAPSIDVEVAERVFRDLINDSSATFPFAIDDSSDKDSTFSGIMRRYELIESCNDFTDECFQARRMTYTTSFKEIPLGRYTGRVIFSVGLPGAWNRPWVLRLRSTMPHDSLTGIDIVLVLVDKKGSFNWELWLTSSGFGQLFLAVLCVLVTMCFILVTKEVGMRLSEPTALNGRRTTVLYEETEFNNGHCLSLYRIMLATQETCMKIFSWLFVAKRAMHRYFHSWPRRRWEGAASNVVISAEMREVASNVEEDSQHMEPQSDCVEMNGSSEESDGDEYVCRICRSKKPVDDLFAPCACDGSAKYVHKKCLEKWRAMTLNTEHRRVCAECKTPYNLVVERVPISPDELLHSPVCVPACRLMVKRAVGPLFFIFLLWIGGYYLKFCMYLVTGLDEGVVWSAANFYHWVLGIYSVVALCLNLWALEYVLIDFDESWQQLLLLIISLCTVEIPLNYVGQITLSWLLNRHWSLEVSYGLGIIVTAVSSITLLPHLYVFLQSLSTEREVVLPRVEGVRNRIIL
ncbi:hypothetical protein TcCL_ESM03910 [Trypanosoma cruzi]|nr:hypothetical protein TcCL_ESM03910 [Trypanosoma cruzi]